MHDKGDGSYGKRKVETETFKMSKMFRHKGRMEGWEYVVYRRCPKEFSTGERLVVRTMMDPLSIYGPVEYIMSSRERRLPTRNGSLYSGTTSIERLTDVGRLESFCPDRS